MIKSFNSKETEKIWEGKRSTKLPGGIQDVARRKLRMLNNSVDLQDLRTPPSNRLEKLKGKYNHYHSMRINDQWRIIFKWVKGHSTQVEIVDYH
jgi:toxin HigB-1